jgi:hypothetical protein
MTRFLGVAVFLAILGIGVVLDQLSRRGRSAAPSFTQLIDWLEARRAGRLILFIGWGFAGWHFFVR